MKIIYETIPHSQQRYDTAGDWQWVDNGGTLLAYGSQMSSEDFEFCGAIHEMSEAYFCKKMGITQKMVDDFDIPYEAAHQRGDVTYPCGCPRLPQSDPGNDIHSPYRWAHIYAEATEAVVARALRVDWVKADAECEKPLE